MKIIRLFTGLLLSLTALAARAQVVTVQPTFFTADTPVTLTFDATQGNAGLADFGGPVYIWTGAVTDKSANQGDWKGGPTTCPCPPPTSPTACTWCACKPPASSKPPACWCSTNAPV